MRKNFVSTVLRTSAFATACLALAGSNVMAVNTSNVGTTATSTAVAGQQVYSTSGSIGSNVAAGASDPTITSPGGTASQAISFVPPTSTLSYNGSSAISLGQFNVATLAAGQETDYKGTPFSITYNPVSFGGMSYAGTSTSPQVVKPIVISGTLTGNVTGNTSSVVATITSISNAAFTSPDGSTLSTLSIPNNPLNLVPNSASGITSVQAYITSTTPSGLGTGGTGPTPTPEPTTLAILATALVGLGLRKRLGKARLAD